MIDSILFSTDLSPLSAEVWEYTIVLARRTGARVTVCYALSIPAPVYALASLDQYTSDLEDSARAKLSDFVGGAQTEGLVIETRLRRGVAERVLNDLAEEVEADLVVLARHGRSRLERFFLGSTAEKILRSSRFPVLVVPEDGPREVEWTPALCALDFSSSSQKVLDFSTRLMGSYGGRLAVLHVVDYLSNIATIATEKVTAGMALLLKHAHQQLEDMLQEHGVPEGTVSFIGEGKPAPMILQEAERLSAGLVIVGECGHGPVERMTVGSTTCAVVRASRVPVLVVPCR